MGTSSRGKPFPQTTAKQRIGKILAPQRGIFHPSLGERTVEIQHADQARPLPRPISHGKDRPSVGNQTTQQMVRILPYRFGNNQRRIGMDFVKNLHPLFLRADKSMLFSRVVFVSAIQLIPFSLDSFRQPAFHRFLCLPAGLVDGKSQITAGDQGDFVFFRFGRDAQLGKVVGSLFTHGTFAYWSSKFDR